MCDIQKPCHQAKIMAPSKARHTTNAVTNHARAFHHVFPRVSITPAQALESTAAVSLHVHIAESPAYITPSASAMTPEHVHVSTHTKDNSDLPSLGRTVASSSAAISFEPVGQESIVPSNEYTVDEEGGWIWGNHPSLSQLQQQTLKDTVRSLKHAFAYDTADLPGYSGVEGPMHIVLQENTHIYTSPRRYSILDQQVRDEKCEELRQHHIIRPATPPCRYACAPVLAAKKDPEGNWTDRRFCIDFRPLNKATIPDRYNLHRPEDIFSRASKAQIFTKLDLRAGFHQIPIDPASQQYTSFWWDNQLWCFTRMPFGLRNAPAVFSRIMDAELQQSGCAAFAIAYIDDVLIFSTDIDEHTNHVRRVLQCLADCGLRAHPEKSVFGSACIEFLGHNLSAGGGFPKPCQSTSDT